jgi:hypothetical protein
MKSLVILVLLILPLCALAQDGNELLKDCTAAIKIADGTNPLSRAESYDGLYCFGLLRGIMDTVQLWETSDTIFKNHVSPGRPCLPKDGIQTRQAARIVVKWLTEHPEQLHHADSVLATWALRDSFSCKP